MNTCKISFPHLGNYYHPISFLLSKITNYEVVIPIAINKETLQLGTKHSPEFVCIPFKYNLGNYIQSLEKGANILIQAGGGCRYGYYAEVQEQILRDLGYKFEFYSLIDNNKSFLGSMHHTFKQLNTKVTYFRFFYYFALTLKMIHYMDKIDIYIRANRGFEIKKGSFDKLQMIMLKELTITKGFFHLRKIYNKYNKLFRKIKINKAPNCLKVGILGELYTSIESAASFNIERLLTDMKIEVNRFTDVTYLVVSKRFNAKKMLKICDKYCKYPIGADGMDNVAMAKTLAEKGYDGLIHTKPFGCTPEIGAMPILQRISEDYQIPIIYFSFDSHTAEEGVKTRIEAFYDMIKMRRKDIND